MVRSQHDLASRIETLGPGTRFIAGLPIAMPTLPVGL